MDIEKELKQAYKDELKNLEVFCAGCGKKLKAKNFKAKCPKCKSVTTIDRPKF